MRRVLEMSEAGQDRTWAQATLKHVASDDAVTGTCRVCGKPIAQALSSAAREAYCCEGCVLAERERRQLAAVVDESQFALAEALAAALDAREHETGLHSKRVACHTLVLAKHFTDDALRLHQVYWGALLHDIGKIGIPDSILLKHGSLSAGEWEIMRGHPEIGYRILAHAPSMAEAAEIVLNHEERFDGSGTQLDPLALEVFVAEEAVLREMVDQKCGAAADVLTSAGTLPGGAASGGAGVGR